MSYTIYNVVTGQIEKSVSCPKDMLHLQFDSTTHSAIEGLFDDSGFYVRDGEATVMPPKPSRHHIFDYVIKQWIDPRTPDTEWPLVRADRDQRLLACDWTQLPDVPLPTKEVWAAYRQALRDITLQTDPFNILWPTPP